MANIRDVAKLAGVSVSAVSKTYNNYDDIKLETKEKIFRAAEELGYIPNNFASNLSKKTKNNIAILLDPNDDREYIDEITMLYTVSMVESASEYNLVPYVILTSTFKGMSFTEVCNFLTSKGIIGIIFFGLSTENTLLNDFLKEETFSKVLLDACFHTNTVSCVAIDDLQAQYDLIKAVHLKYNFKRFLYISGSMEAFVSIQRTYGIVKFENEFPETKVQRVDGNFNKDKVREIIRNTNLDDFDCIICASDMMAFIAKKEIGDTSDILVCGFDNIGLIKYTYPDMPTIAQDFFTKGQASVKALSDLIAGGEGTLVLQPHRIINV